MKQNRAAPPPLLFKGKGKEQHEQALPKIHKKWKRKKQRKFRENPEKIQEKIQEKKQKAKLQRV